MNDRHEPEKWRVLCELASREQDSSKLIRLINELNRALDESLNLKMRRVCATPAIQLILCCLPSFCFCVARAPLRLRSGQALARERRRLLPKCSPITRSSNHCHPEPSFIAEQCAFSAIAWPEPEYAAPGSLTSRCTCSGITT